MAVFYTAGIAPRTWKTLVLLSYGAVGVAPHGETTRWTFTAPQGRPSLVYLIQTQATRAAVASAGWWYRADIKVNNTLVLRAMNIANTVGAGDAKVLSQAIPLREFDVITAVTADASTGGSVDYTQTAVLIEVA
jgi:hypothetical protein